MRCIVLAVAIAGCDTAELYIVMVPDAKHACDFHLRTGGAPIATGEDALALTGIDPEATAPPATLPMQVDWTAGPAAASLDAAVTVVRQDTPQVLAAYEVPSPRGGCPSGTVLEAGYEVSLMVEGATNPALVWTRANTDLSVVHREVGWAMPLEEAPPPIQQAAVGYEDPERPHARVIFTVFDRPVGRSTTWVLERTRFFYDPDAQRRETPRQWLLARGTWTEAGDP